MALNPIRASAPQREIALAGPPARAPWPSPGTGKVLLVWRGERRLRGEEIWTALLDPRMGAKTSPPLLLSQGWAAGATFDSGSRKHLVAVVQDGLIWGYLLGDRGIPEASFPIAAFHHQGPATGAQPLVASDGRGTFLVAWTDRDDRGPNGLDIYIQWVSVAGRPILAPRPAVAATPRAEYLSGRSLAWDPAHGRFILIWTEGDRRGLVYSYIYPDGRISRPRLLGIRGTQPHLCLDEKRESLLLSYESLQDRSPHYRRFDLSLRPLEPDRSLPGRHKGVDLPACSFDPRTATFLLTWRNDFDPYFYGQLLDRTGKSRGHPFIAVRLSGFTQHLLSLPRPEGGFLLVYEDGSPRGPVARVKALHLQERLERANIKDHPGPTPPTKTR